MWPFFTRQPWLPFFTSLHKTAILYISSQDGPALVAQNTVFMLHIWPSLSFLSTSNLTFCNYPPCPLCLHPRVCVYIHVRNTCTSPLPENAAVTTPTAVTTLTAVTTHAHRHLPFTYAFMLTTYIFTCTHSFTPPRGAAWGQCRLC